MRSGPSKPVETILAVLLPPACREEVLGDLYERYRSPRQYALDAFCTVPLVILSRIRRTADPQILLIQAFALYASFLAAAWFRGRALLGEPWGFLRLAIPAAMILLALVLDDAYASPGRRSALSLARGPVLGVIAALVSQAVFRVGNPGFALPLWITVYGCATSLLLSSAVRILFPPMADQLQGVNAPAQWLKRTGASAGNPQGDVRVLKAIFAIIAVAVGVWMLARAGRPAIRLVPIFLVLVVAYWVRKRV